MEVCTLNDIQDPETLLVVTIAYFWIGYFSGRFFVHWDIKRRCRLWKSENDNLGLYDKLKKEGILDP